jgi:hypothetical protein
VSCPPDRADAAGSLLTAAGAEEIRR